MGKQFPIGGMVTLTPLRRVESLGTAASAKNELPSPTAPTRTPWAAWRPQRQDVAFYDSIGLTDHVMTRLYGGRASSAACCSWARRSPSPAGQRLRPGQGDEQRYVPAVLTLDTTLGARDLGGARSSQGPPGPPGGFVIGSAASRRRAPPPRVVHRPRGHLQPGRAPHRHARRRAGLCVGVHRVGAEQRGERPRPGATRAGPGR